jgi:hypothetical protein
MRLDMKVFISWSGPLSREVAEALRDWLPSVLQYVEPWVSSEDIAKGTRWSVEVGHELESSDFGIICVTPGNVERPWLNFEAGGLAHKFDESRVSPFLFGVGHAAIAASPLAQFQATLYDRADVLKLVRSINSKSETRLLDSLLAKAVSQWWPNLQEALDPLLTRAHAEAEEPKRDNEAMISELLERALDKVRPSAVKPDPLSTTPRLKELPRGGVDVHEVTILLARLRAATSEVVPNRPDTPVMVELRARIMLLVKALAPIVDTALVDSLMERYAERFTEYELAKTRRQPA